MLCVGREGLFGRVTHLDVGFRIRIAWEMFERYRTLRIGLLLDFDTVKNP